MQKWIATKWLEIDQDNLHIKFLGLNVDFSSLIPDPLGSRRLAQVSVKDGYPPWKDVILVLLARLEWQRLQIGTVMLLIITSAGDRLFSFINIDYLERPWTPQKRFLVNFFAIFGCSAHSNTYVASDSATGWHCAL